MDNMNMTAVKENKASLQSELGRLDEKLNHMHSINHMAMRLVAKMRGTYSDDPKEMKGAGLGNPPQPREQQTIAEEYRNKICVLADVMGNVEEMLRTLENEIG